MPHHLEVHALTSVEVLGINSCAPNRIPHQDAHGDHAWLAFITVTGHHFSAALLCRVGLGSDTSTQQQSLRVPVGSPGLQVLLHLRQRHACTAVHVCARPVVHHLGFPGIIVAPVAELDLHSKSLGVPGCALHTTTWCESLMAAAED